MSKKCLTFIKLFRQSNKALHLHAIEFCKFILTRNHNITHTSQKQTGRKQREFVNTHSLSSFFMINNACFYALISFIKEVKKEIPHDRRETRHSSP